MTNKIATEFVEAFDKYRSSQCHSKLGEIEIGFEGGLYKRGIEDGAYNNYWKLQKSKRISAKFENRLKDLTRLLGKLMQGHLYDTPDGKAPEGLEERIYGRKIT